jgi:hydrogenase/urease accessory protein HupE
MVLALAFSIEASLAHPTQFTTLQIKVEPAGQFQAILNIDILSFALGKTSAESTNEELQTELDGPRAHLAQDLADADARFQREVVIRTDIGDIAPTTWELPGLPEVDAVLARKLQPPILMPGQISFSGTLPPNAHTISIRLPYILGDTVQVYELPNGESHDEPVPAGDYCSQVKLDLAPPNTTSRLTDFGRYVAVGFKHIVPYGLDHILFVLGLYLLSNRIAPLLWQISAFTIAHSITLGLSLYGIIRLPPTLTEPLIAASIVCIAVENLYTSELKPWRPFVVFGFGLIHGLGFASAFANIGLPKSDFLIALIGFNLGVECGQLAIICAAFLTLGWFRNRPWYRKNIVIPASLLIAISATCWIIQRLFGP